MEKVIVGLSHLLPLFSAGVSTVTLPNAIISPNRSPVLPLVTSAVIITAASAGLSSLSLSTPRARLSNLNIPNLSLDQPLPLLRTLPRPRSTLAQPDEFESDYSQQDIRSCALAALPEGAFAIELTSLTTTVPPEEVDLSKIDLIRTQLMLQNSELDVLLGLSSGELDWSSSICLYAIIQW